jgi:hypothetical protein
MIVKYIIMTKAHLGRKLRKTGKRLLKVSRKGGRTLARGTGFVRKMIGTADALTGGLATQAMMSNPYSGAVLTGLKAVDKTANMLANPTSTIQHQIQKRR